MAPAPGTRLGPYELVSLIGAGGMGEVYRARDAKLDRDVAIKVLPEHLACDGDARARFEREARAVAALSHPNILAIFDFGLDAGTSYAVTELLDGETLRDRLAAGPLGSRKAVEYGLQVARGLAAAHDRGIVHRDLKPENVFVTRDDRVKILDFGLARPVAPAETRDAAATRFQSSVGTIAGTAGYMAPEQARGQHVDHRADIFAFGLLLYEMLTGTRAFGGATPADTVSALLTAEPANIDALAHSASPALDRIVRRCIEKRPELRFQSAQDLAFSLETLSSVSSSSASPTAVPAPTVRTRRRFVVPAIVVMALAAGGALGAWLMRSGAIDVAIPAPTAAFSFDAGFVFPPLLSLSPDGRTIVYTAPSATSGAVGVTWLRRLDGSASPPAFPSRTVDYPLAWSPDSRRVVVYSAGKLVAVDATTGARETIVGVPGIPRGVVWLPDGSLIVGTQKTVARIPAGGGPPADILQPDAAHDAWLGWPLLLPGGTRLIYAAKRAAPVGTIEWRVGLRDGTGARSADTVILKDVTGVQFAAPDALFYVRGGTLFVQRFDPGRPALVGDPVSLATEVYENAAAGRAALGVSASGVVTYRKEQFPRQSFVWVDRSGRRIGEFPRRDTFTNFDLSPDGTRIAVTVRMRPYSLGSQMWLLDLVRGMATDVSEPGGSGGHSDALWAPDGTRLAFRLGDRVLVRPADGGASVAILGRTAYPETWSRDGRYIVAGVPVNDDYQLWSIDLAQNNKTAPLVTGAQALDEPKFKPDGRWVAYNGSEGGRSPEVYVVPFPPTGQRFQVSVQGGTQPRWRGDGQELYYLGPDGTLMTVRVPGGDVRRIAQAEPLFQTGLEVSSSFDQYTPSVDGQRFLIRHPEGTIGDRAPVYVIVNWRALLAR